MMDDTTESFDVLVVGTGVAASTVASRCADAGRHVAVVDERPFGGTCQLRGCDPKKVLRRGAEVIEAARLMHGRGMAEVDDLRVDWSALMQFKRRFTDSVPDSKEKSFRTRGIACFHGHASFHDHRTMAVGDQLVQADRIVLANGARPMSLPIDGAEYLTRSDQFMELDALPPRLVFAGGGYIAFELAHLAARAGATATILEKSDRPLGSFDDDLVAALVERGHAAGIEVHVQSTVTAIEQSAGALVVHADVAGRQQSFEADCVVHGLGRVPATRKLDCEAGGVTCTDAGIKVNDYLQSVSNPTVYAAGDVAATAAPPLTPVASMEGGLVAANLLEGNHCTADYCGIPSCVFTIPPLAAVGMGEAEAARHDPDFDCRRSDMSGWYFVRRIGETCALAKVLVDSRDRRILGAHLLGPQCDELINFFALAIRKRWRAEDLASLVNAYPTAASNLASLV